MAFKPIAHNLNSKWRSEDVKIQESADFSSLLLSNKVLAGLQKAGYQSPSPIQIEAIPVGRFGKDLVVQAKSGTGKTLVFSIVALEMILIDVKQPQVLIIAPTREIAHQICSVIEAVGCEFDNLNCCTFIGGTYVSEDKENLTGCQIAVGTPGRIKHLIKDGVLKTNCIRLFVLDEADQLLDASFQSDVDEIFLTLPKDKQVIATSATYPQKLQVLADRYFRNPYLARLNIDELALLGTVHYVQTIDVPDLPVLIYKKKLECLERVLTSISFSQCLIFCNAVSRVPILSSDIRDWGFTTTSISSSKEQADRLKAIDRLKLFKCKVLVSSDLTSRGIDAENVNLVVNFDLPYTKEIYLHRVGRAGRYGSRGLAVTLLLQKESAAFQTIRKTANFTCYDLPDPIPQNLMNIRPQGFKGCEDGFETRTETSEMNVDSNSNLELEDNTEDNIDASSDPNCNQIKCDDVDSRDVEIVANAPITINEGEESNVCNGNYLLTHGKDSSGSVETDSQQRLVALINATKYVLSRRDSVIDSYEVVKSEAESENSSEPKGDVDKTCGVEDNRDSDFHNGIACFLKQMQMTEDSNDKTLISQSDDQTKESLDSFYYNIFKTYAEENMPDLVTEDQTKGSLSGIKPENSNGNNLNIELNESKEPTGKASRKSNVITSTPYKQSSSDSTDSDSIDIESISVPRNNAKKHTQNATFKSFSRKTNVVTSSTHSEKSSSDSTESDSSESVSAPRNSVRKAPVLLNNSSGGVASARSRNDSDPKVTHVLYSSYHNTSSASSDRSCAKAQVKSKLKYSSNSKVKKPSHKVDKPITKQRSSNSHLGNTDGFLNQKVAIHAHTDMPSHAQSYDMNGGRSRGKLRRPKCNPHKYSSHGPVQNTSQTSHACNSMIQPHFNTIPGSCNVGYSNPCIQSRYCCGSHHASSIPNYCNPPQNHCYSSCGNSGDPSANVWYDTFSKQWQHIHNLCYFR